MKSIAILCSAFSIFLLHSSPAMAQVKQKPADIVDVKSVDPTILVDMMYATKTNFMGRVVDGYKANVCYLTRSAAEGLKKGQAKLQAIGKAKGLHYSLLIRDCYRPAKAVHNFVEWSRDDKDIEMKSVYYPDISKPDLIRLNYISPVSGHSRASSVDLTIAKLETDGEVVQLPMGTTVDFFGDKSHTAYPNIRQEERDNRELLKKILTPDFKNYANEWWHYALVTEPYPKTTFDFDVDAEPPVSRHPQSVGATEISTQFSNPSLLSELDRRADSPLSLFHLLSQLEKQPPALTARATGADLESLKNTYGKFSAQVAADVARIIKELGIDWEKDITKTYDRNSSKTAAGKILRGNGNVTRIFNEKWLSSKMGQFLLSGVVNRIDRREFTPGTCGEVRFIYRFAYEMEMNGEVYASRTPFTLNMVYNYKDDSHDCQSVASLWNLQSVKNDDPVIVARRLLTGPLDFSNLVFKQMEMNAQVARFPSDLENEEGRKFAGQAVYLMRIFGIRNGLFYSRKLENTPDVQALSKDPALRAKLADYIKKNIKLVDAGIQLIPDEFLADVAISYSTLGSSRVANKPFDKIFTPAEAQKIFESTSLPASQFVANGNGLLERLNTSSCMGCHQASSTAGFHFLGMDRNDFGTDSAKVKTALDGNRLVLPFSPHLFSDLPRRTAYVAAIASGDQPNLFRPHPSAPAAEWSSTNSKYQAAADNAPCTLSNDIKANWSCHTGTKCVAVVTNKSQAVTMGQCVPDAQNIYGGLTCRLNDIADATTAGGDLLAFNVRSFTDKVTKDEQLYKLPEGTVDAKSLNCRPTKIGVPLGRVTKACTPEQMSLKGLNLDSNPKDICAVVGGKGFEEMARGYFSSAKFAAGVGRGILNTCSPTRFCREDYICQEMPDFLTGARFGVSAATIAAFREKKVGFCTPTYFVYQLRLDGHPNPN